jgi:hypothetical protein
MSFTLRNRKNKELNKPMVILSAELKDNTKDLNDQSTWLLNRLLKEGKFRFKAVFGYYKGTSEKSFLVMLDNIGDLKELKHLGLDILRQESILYIDRNRNSSLVFKDNSTKKVGKLTEINEIKGIKLDNYTYDVINNRYYTTREV